MAVNAVSAVVHRLQNDTGFRSQYVTNPDQALSAYKLSGDETRALKTGDGFHLELMGLGKEWCDFVETVCGPHPGP